MSKVPKKSSKNILQLPTAFENAMKKIVSTPKEAVEKAMAEEKEQNRNFITAHELAKKLLEMPDWPVLCPVNKQTDGFLRVTYVDHISDSEGDVDGEDDLNRGVPGRILIVPVE